MNIEVPKINIRNGEEKDIALMIRYRIDYLTEMQGEREVSFIEQLKVEMLGFFRKSMANGSFIALVAEYEGSAVAYGGMILREVPGDFNRSSYLEGDILNMYTIPTARRMGISTLILKQLLSNAKSMGVTKIALHTSLDGEKLYRSVGFSEPIYPYLELPIVY
jgi:GNAT superfamily N-acetyltransferase